MSEEPPSPDQIALIRQGVEAIVIEKGEDKFYKADLDRLRNQDEYVSRFYKHVAGGFTVNIEEHSISMIISTFLWRKDNSIENLKEDSSISEPLKSKGSLYLHNYDRDGKRLLIFAVKKHIKGAESAESLRHHLIYCLERADRESNGDQITIVFDCAGCGLKNMDMDFIQYMINLLREYYPYILNYILIFEMPWVLNAAFKVIKTWLPAEAVRKIKFVTKASISEFIEADQMLSAWGGTDDWEYKFIPESSITKALPATDSPKKSDSRNKLFSITPSDAIKFVLSRNGDVVGKVLLTNLSQKFIIFKIKTTSPDKYRVRPSLATLEPGACSSIEILLNSSTISISRDKFLVTAIEIEESGLSLSQMTRLMKSKPPEDSVQLRCNMDSNTLSSLTESSSSSSPNDCVENKISKIERNQMEILENVQALKKVLYLILIFVTFLFVDKFATLYFF